MFFSAILISLLEKIYCPEEKRERALEMLRLFKMYKNNLSYDSEEDKEVNHKHQYS
jgi:hypothetical protein